MKTLTGFLIVILILALVAALFYGGYYAVQALWMYFSKLDFIVRIILLSGIASVLLASLIIAAAIRSSAKITAGGSVVKEKIELYKKLIEIHFSSKNAGVELEKLRPDVVLLASGPVLEVFEKLLSIPKVDNNHESKLNGLYSQLIRNIRHDLGHRSTIGDSRIKQLLASKEHFEMEARQSL